MSVQSLRYAYFPGCVAQGACRELSQSTQALAQVLKIELVELKQAACCGSGTFREESQAMPQRKLFKWRAGICKQRSPGEQTAS